MIKNAGSFMKRKSFRNLVSPFSRQLSVIGLCFIGLGLSSADAVADVTCTLLSDTQVRTLPSLPKPPYLQPMIDPTFGTKITRITGDPGTAMGSIGTWGNVSRHGYSTRQAWNADQSLIWLAENTGGTPSSSVFLDGSTYQPLFAIEPPSSGTADVVWHVTNPNTMVYAHDAEIGYWNVRTNAVTPVRDFTGYTNLKFGPWKGNFSLDGTLVTLSGNGPTGAPVFFAYNIATNAKYPDIDGTNADSVFMSPKGNYVVMKDSSEHTTVYTLNGAVVGQWTEYGRPSHFDLSLDQNGDEVAVGVDKSSSDTYEGKVIKRRLSDGAVTVLTGGAYPSWAWHTSTRDTSLLGWAVSSYEDNGSSDPLYNREILAIKLDGSVVYRLGDNHSENPDYWAQVQGSVSPDGLRVIFASDWENAITARPVQAYVIDLRPSCSTSTGGTGGGTVQPPIANDVGAITVMNRPVTINVLAKDSDPQGLPLKVVAVTVPAHGTATINADSTVTYTLKAKFVGTDTFNYTISDGSATATATVRVSIIRHFGAWQLAH